MKRVLFILLFGVAETSLTLRAQDNVVISEFMAANNTFLQDEERQYSDWIELYNAGTNVVNLDRWCLTDASGNLAKWRFPAVTLASHEYLLVFASGQDRTNATGTLHTNFRLDADGEYLALVKPDGATVVSAYTPRYPAQTPDVSYGLGMLATPADFLVPAGATAKILIPTGDIGLDWTGLAYNDATWLSGPTGLGFDLDTNYAGVIGTNLQARMYNVAASAYIRIPFEVADPLQIQELKLRMFYDDGFIAYLNGAEVERRNAPTNASWDSAATRLHGSEAGLAGRLQADFDTVTNAFTPTQAGAAPGPSIQAGGADSTGWFLRLINDDVNNNGNAIAFDQTAPGLFSQIVADFNFRMISPADQPADGFAFMIIPTGTYGTNGPGAFRSAVSVEKPTFTNVLAIGFDMHPHVSQNDVSAHWNGVEYVNFTIPRSTIEMVSGWFHRCHVEVNYASEGAYVTVVITPNINGTAGPPLTVINQMLIPGVPTYDCRVEFAGRSSSLNMSVDLDNIDVRFGYGTGPVTPEDFDLAPVIPLLQTGPNLLAIHGLNVASNSADFLVLPELVSRGVGLQATSQLYFAQPTPDGVNSLGVGETVPAPEFSVPGGVYASNLLVELSSPVPGAVIHYTLNGVQPSEWSATYTEPIGVSNSVLLTARAYAAGYVMSPPVAHSYALLDNNLVSFSSGLPLIIIDTYGKTIQQDMDPRVTATLTVIDTPRPSGRATLLGPRNYQGRAGIEGRGQTSWGFAKKPYNVELRDDYDRDQDVSLLGMPAESDWVLFNPYNDKTFMNDILAYELYEDMGHYSVRRRYCEVFLNGARPDGAADPSGKVAMNDYVGIYGLLERIKIDPNRVDIQTPQTGQPGDPITGGYMWKKDKGSPGDVVFTTPSQTGTDPASESLKYHDPKAQDLTPVQRAWLTNHLTEFENVLFGSNWRDPVNGYAKYIDQDSFVDCHWIVEFTKQIDGYRLSDYLILDRGGKIKFNPMWDWNLSFGNANYLQGGLTNGWYYSLISGAQHMYLRRLVGDGGSTAGDPDFVQKTIDRWGELRLGLFHPSNVLARVDRITNQLWEAQARDFPRWPRLGTYLWPNPNGTGANGDGLQWHVDFQNPTTYAGIIAELKKWINGRYAWIDGLYLKAPYLSRAAGPSDLPLSMLAAAGAIYYTTDGSDPRLPGGLISPSAQVYTDPITVPPQARICARAWHTNAWSPPTRGEYGDPVPQLAITEIMYHPAASPNPAYADEDFEFIELANTSSNTIELKGMRLDGAVHFTFPGGPLQDLGPDTANAFDGTGTSYAASTLSDGPGATVKPDGPSTSYMQLATQGTGTNRNRITFDQTAAGLCDRITADFDFRASNATPPPVTGTATLHDFDDPGSAYVISPATGTNIPAVLDGGPSGRYMRITPAVGSLQGIVFFDRTATGAFNVVIASFDFRIAGAADGMCFAILNTATQGTNGIASGSGTYSEEPNIAGSLGVGFDIYLNSQSAAEPNANHVSLHWNNTQVSATAATPRLSLTAGRFHRAKVTMKFVTNPNRALVTVELTPDIYGAGGEPEVLFKDFAIANAVAYQGRVAFGARTGGSTATHDIDNVNVQYFSEIPDAGGLSLVWLPTSTFGLSGPGSTLSDYLDLPNLPQAFAVDLNLHSASIINGVTLHWDGTTKGNAVIDPAVLDLDNGQFHRARVEIQRDSLNCLSQGSWVTMTIQPDVYGTPGAPITVFSNLFVAGFAPDELRLECAARAGAMNLDIDLDNLTVKSQAHTANSLEPGQRLVVAANRTAFELLYADTTIAGEYTGRLDNKGERLILYARCGEPILDFRYQDSWYPMTDGQGFSLVMANPSVPASSWNDPAVWRPSAQPGGSPGRIDPAPPMMVPVVVNEALSHSDATLVPGIQDAIELHNPSSELADVGNWYLSDDFNTPRKYRIPANTTIQPGGFLVVYESVFNPNPNDPASFGLSAEGDQIYLFSADAADNLTGYYHGFDFGPAESNVTFGRQVLSTRAEDFVAQAARTLGETNAGPLVGPVVITEIMYHPLDYPGAVDNQEDEFIELRNITEAPVALDDTAHPGNTWRLTDAVDYQFPSGLIIPAGGYLLVVGFDPAENPAQLQAFRDRYGLVGTELIVGPYEGKLDNSSDRVELKKPGVPDPNTLQVPYILVDRVHYADQPPLWPLGADGLGQSLHRLEPSGYGNDPANWTVGRPIPGGPASAGTPPEITTQPASQSVIAGTTVTFSVQATRPGSYRYQWRGNGINLPGATNATLQLVKVSLAQAGEYRVVVLSEDSSVDSDPATLTVGQCVTIVQQPLSATVRPGTPVTFEVTALGNGPLSYQWRRQGRTIAGATASTFRVEDPKFEDAGGYTVLVSDLLGTQESNPAELVLLVNPSIVVQPVAQTNVVGSTVTFSVQVTNAATLPIGYRWRKGTANFAHRVLNSRIDFLTLTNLQTTNEARYSVVVTNQSSYTPGILSQQVQLTVLPLVNMDGDCLPDDYESAHGLDPNDPQDGAHDADGDGISNCDEYLSGTDPQDPVSFLKVEILADTGQAVIRFNAVASKTYVVQFRDRVSDGPWQTLAGVPAAPGDPTATRPIELVDTSAPVPGQRYYRLVTPALSP